MFIEELSNYTNLSLHLTAIDIDENELLKASKKWSKSNGLFKKADFLEFEIKTKQSVIIGNPPYVKKNRLTEKQIEFIKEIHFAEKLTDASVKNIWTTFLIKSTTVLKTDGILAFILPSELLQVKFAEEIRSYLKREFERIEIFTFNDLMFDCKGQDTIVLFAFKKHANKGEFFTNISSKEELKNSSYILKENNILVKSNIKWTHHFLSLNEITFLEKLKSKLLTVHDYALTKPGIVTAANSFFIINKETEKQYKLSKFTKPIIQKGFFVNGSIVFDNNALEKLEQSNVPTRLLHLKDDDVITPQLQNYLEKGEALELPSRYKCSLRNNWYVIPNVSTKPNAFFFKRSHHYPKVLKNLTDALVTDSAYKIDIKAEYDLNSFIYSFYNSLTLVFSEIEGRYYGGGVLELTPSEFKKLPIPYVKISEESFVSFTSDFKNKKTIEDVLLQNDFHILNTTLNLSREEIKKLRSIRAKLVAKRMRKPQVEIKSERLVEY